MHAVNQTPPDRMTPQQRRREIASTLATGLARLRAAGLDRSADATPESEFELAFSCYQSVHTDPANRNAMESR